MAVMEADKKGRNKISQQQARRAARRPADDVPEVPNCQDMRPGIQDAVAEKASRVHSSPRSDGLEKAGGRVSYSVHRPSSELIEDLDRRVSLYRSESFRSVGLEALRQASDRMEERVVEEPQAALHRAEKGSQEGAHGHAEKAHSLLTACVSGLINFLLMFGMCCAFGMIMFDEVNARWQPLGVKMCLATSALCGLIVAAFSRIPVAIAGPDLNPIVFLGAFVATLAPAIAASVGLSYPGQDEFTCGRRLEEDPFDLTAAAQAFGARMLGGAGGSSCSGPGDTFCKEGSDSYDAAACSEYNQQLVTTTIFAVAFSSALFGLFLFLAGRFSLTRYVNFVPSSISEAFLSCVGYKVFAYALKFCHYDPKQFLPAGIIGVLLYFIKALHVGNPAVMIPAILMIPLIIFHVLVASGVLYDDLDHARAEGIMFPHVGNCDFWTVWTEGISDGSEWKFQHINFKAWTKTIPDLVTMIIVVMMDCLLKIKNTENKLPIVPESTYESQLFGICNAMMFACGSPCGYMQLKFNVINFGIMGNSTDRRGGMIYAALCAVCFFGTTAPFNYLPRFFLSMLLFFAGAGFVAENLYGSSKYMSFKEWLEVVGILFVFIISGQLIYAVAVGVLFTAVFFCLKYARIPVLARTPERGGSITSYARRDPLIRVAVKHIADAWFFVVPVKGYVFFASAKTLIEMVKSCLHSKSTLTVSMCVSAGTSLGLELRDCSDGKSLLVTGIVDGGLVSQWNEENPNESIEPGDLIVNVRRDLNRSMLESRSFHDMRISVSALTTSKLMSLTALKPGSSTSCHDLRQQLEREGPLRISLVRESSRPYKRARFVIFDCSMLDGMDCSACAIFRRLISHADACGTAFLWTNLQPSVMKSLQKRGIIKDPNTCFSELDHAVYKVEETILQYRREMVSKWLQVHPAFQFRYKQISLARSFDPFMHVFETDAERRGCPWLYCTRLHIQRFRTILWGPDQEEQCLFLIHSGAVGVYSSLPDDSGAALDGNQPNGWLPSAMYEHGWFVNRKFVLQGRSHQDYGVAIQDGEVLCWNTEQWCKMSRQRPLMAAAILKAAMRQQLMEAEERHLRFSPPPADRPAGEAALPSRGASKAKLGGGADASPPQLHAAFPPHLPPEARAPIRALGSVRALDALGLWSAPGPSGAQEAAAPPLPKAIREDLSRAFRLYCEEGPDGPRLPQEMLRKALMFSGIFGVELSQQTRSLTHDEFIAMGHEASVARLSEKQRQTLLQLFEKYDADMSGTLDRHELPDMFIKELSIPASVVDSISGDVDCGDGCIDKEGFLWIVSRLIRTHENDFMMWKVLCELTGSSDSTADAELTVEMLKERSTFQASDEEWEEMCWAVDLSASSPWGHEESGIDFSELVTMVIAQDRPGQLLPPLDNECLAWGQWVPWKRSESGPLSKAVVEEVKSMVLDRRCGGALELKQRRNSWGSVDEGIANAGERDDEQDSPYLALGRAQPDPEPEPLPDCLQKLQCLLEDPSSSQEAYRVSVCIGVLIVLSILNNVAAALTDRGMTVDWSSPFWILDIVLAALFSVELALRAVASGAVGPRSLASFLCRGHNLLDLLAVMPTYLDLLMSNAGLGQLSVLRAFRLLRLAQLARLGRLSEASALAAPVTTVLIVIWGIYLKESVGQDAQAC